MTKKAPFPFYLLLPSRQEHDRSKLLEMARRIFGFLLGSAALAIGVGLLFVKPWSILTCRHVEPGQTDCRIEKRIAWVNSVQEITVTDLEQAVVRWERAVRIEEDGERTGYLVYDVVLVSDSGEVSLAGADETWALSAQPTADRINAYLDAPTEKPLTIWGRDLWVHTVSTLASWTLLLFTSIALLIFAVSSTVLFGAWALEGVLSAVQWVLDRGGPGPRASGRIARLRQAVRVFAIRPNGDDLEQTDRPKDN